VARLRDPPNAGRLESVGVQPVPLDISGGDFSALPHDFTYVFHAAVDVGTDDWRRCVQTNARVSGDLVYHCRSQRLRVLLGPARSTHTRAATASKRMIHRASRSGRTTASRRSPGKQVCTWVATRFDVPLTIIRICSTYGPEGGAPSTAWTGCLRGEPIRLYPDPPNNFNPIYEDDYVDLGIRAMEVAALPPITVNWAAARPSAPRNTAPTWAGSSGSTRSSSTPRRPTRRYGRT